MSDQQLTQPDLAESSDYTEVWEVYMSNQREPYYLNELEYAVFRDTLLRGIKGVVHFDRFGLNTAFYVSSYRKSRTLRPDRMPKQIEDGRDRPSTPEEREKTRLKIEEIRKKLHVKFSAT